MKEVSLGFKAALGVAVPKDSDIEDAEIVGEVAERIKAPVLKTDEGKPSVGSNPTLSAISVEPVKGAIAYRWSTPPKSPRLSLTTYRSPSTPFGILFPYAHAEYSAQDLDCPLCDRPVIEVHADAGVSAANGAVCHTGPLAVKFYHLGEQLPDDAALVVRGQEMPRTECEAQCLIHDMKRGDIMEVIRKLQDSRKLRGIALVEGEPAVCEHVRNVDHPQLCAKCGVNIGRETPEEEEARIERGDSLVFASRLPSSRKGLT